MGVFYNSICVPAGDPDEVLGALDRWLAGRGFRASEEPVLFDLDADSERSAFLVRNDSWVVLFFSQWDEERRLIRELQSSFPALLYLWVFDSDAWGWDLFDSDGFVGSFSSSPGTYQSFGDDTVSSAGRPGADADELCRRLGVDPSLAEPIRALQRRPAAFKEDLCRELCQLLGLEAALSSYDDLETGSAQGQHGQWNRVQRVYFHYDAATSGPDDPLELHRVRLHASPDDPLSALRSQPIEISPELLREMERMRRRARVTLLLLRPLSWLARGWRSLYEASFRLRGDRRSETEDAVPESPLTVQPTDTATRHEVWNSRHGVRVLLPQGIEPLSVSGKPSAVLAFRYGATTVTCTARRRRHVREVLRPPSRSKVLEDDRYRVGPLAARRVVYELPPRPGGGEVSHLTLNVVETFRALYVFLYRYSGAADPELDAGVRAVVGSFRLTEEALREKRNAPSGERFRA
ncbi:MAG: hypothetical protein AAGN66_19020 [Acidobacteriota bacterium]